MDICLDKMMNMRLKLTKIDGPGNKYSPPLVFKEHFISHFCEDIRNLGPLPLLKTDIFESQHSPYKQIRLAKRTSVNILYTLSHHHERLSVYNSTGHTLPHDIEKVIVDKNTDEIVMDYLSRFKVKGNSLYECSKLSVFGTAYTQGQYVILPESSESLMFGKIEKLLCCEKFGYILYRKTIAKYCTETDLFLIKELKKCEVIPVHQLPDYRPLQGYTIGLSHVVIEKNAPL